MKIVHFSDWHGSVLHLPAADLYVCTGDMLPNYPVRTAHRDLLTGEDLYSRRIDPFVERVRQQEWIKRFVEEEGGYDELLASSRVPLVCVRGNHDFVEDFGSLFAGVDRVVHEINGNSVTIDVCGRTLKVGGFRGIPEIFGSWSDELDPIDSYDRVHAVDADVDLLVTHCPPHGILDDMGFSTPMHVGMQALASRITKLQMTSEKNVLHVFGHIHEQGALVERHGSWTFSNAATHYNVIEL